MAPRKPGGNPGGGGSTTPPPELALPPSPTAPPAAGIVAGEDAGGSLRAAPEAQRMGRETISRRSPFELWPREALVDVLLAQNIELRHEADLSHEHLAKICTRYFADKPLPPLPPTRPRAREQQQRAEAAAVVIQRAWVQHAAAMQRRKMLARQASDRGLMDGGVLVPPGAANVPQPLSCPTTAQAARELETPWLAPDVALAKEYAELNHPRKGGPGGAPFPLRQTTLGRYCVLGGCGEQLDLWDEGQVSELSLYGSGITNYFKMLKWEAWTAFCLFLLFLPQLILNAFGDGQPAAATAGLDAVSRTTLGHLMRTLEVQGGVVTIPFCERLAAAYFPTAATAGSCTLDRSRLLMLYTYVNVAGALFLFVSFLWMKQFQKLEERVLDRHAVTASDFSIKVTNLPPQASEAAIRAHFARVLEVPVAEVAVAFDDGALIERYKLRGLLVKRRDYVVNRVRFIKELQRTGNAGAIGSWFLQRELPRLTEANTLLLQRIAQLDHELGEQHARTKALAAFVTFDHQDAFVHALAVYKSASWLCMDPALRFKGRRIRVEPAPEPSLILWENLGHGRLDRWRRKAVVWLLASSLILVSIVIYFIARYYQDQNRTLDAICPPAWDSMSPESQRQTAGEDHAFLGCLCKPLPFQAQAGDPLCQLYVQKQGLSTFWTVFSSFLVVSINYCIQLGLERMTAYEKAHSLDRQKLEAFFQIFALKFINTGAVILLLNSAEVRAWLGMPLASAAAGNFTRDFYYTTGISLLMVMLVNVVASVAPYGLYYLKALKTMRQAERGQLTGLITQEQMNAVFMGPEFPVATRAAANLVVFFTCVVYGQGMPLLFLVAAATALVGYWADKFLFLRYYRVPPRFGRKLSRGVANTAQAALLLHLLVSIWAYAQDELSPPLAPDTPLASLGLTQRLVARNTRWTGPIHPYLVKAHVAPLVVTLVVLAAGLAGRHLLLAAFRALRACVRCLTCHRGPPGSAFRRDPFGTADLFGGELNIVDTTYTRAVDRGLIKGLCSYNILENPRYQAAFAISDRFAQRHRHLESLRGHLALPFEDDESEGDDDMQDGGGDGDGGAAAAEVMVSYDVEAGRSAGRASPGGRVIMVRTPQPDAPPCDD